jgi:hypothetical protein
MRPTAGSVRRRHRVKRAAMFYFHAEARRHRVKKRCNVLFSRRGTEPRRFLGLTEKRPECWSSYKATRPTCLCALAALRGKS